jgi:hypothetical protein
MTASRLSCVAALLAALLTPALVRAEPSESLKEVARNLMAEGRELRDKSDHQGALSRFQAADAIMGVPTTGFEIARSQADLLLLLEAQATLRRILSTPEKPDDPEPFRAARMKARALDVELASRIGGLRFLVRGAQDHRPRLRVDDQELAGGELDKVLRLNPGQHRVVGRVGEREVTRDVAVPERETVTVELDFAVPREPSGDQHDQPAAASAPARDPAPRQRSDSVPTLGYVGGGVAAVGLIVGSVSGVWAMSKKSSAWAGCEGTRCPPSTWEDIDAARRFATVSTVGFVVAGVGAGIGVGALLFGRQTPSNTASVELYAAPGRLRLCGRF